MTEEEWKARHFDFKKSVMGEAANITDKELEGKDALDKIKYIFSNGYNEYSQITLIKAVCTLAKEVDALRAEIDELKKDKL